MKRLMCFVFIIVLIFGLAGCKIIPAPAPDMIGNDSGGIGVATDISSPDPDPAPDPDPPDDGCDGHGHGHGHGHH